MIQKNKVIIIGKTQQDIVSKKQNKVLIVIWALIFTQKAIYQAVMRLKFIKGKKCYLDKY